MMLPYQKQMFHIQLYLLANPDACLGGGRGGGDISDSGICVCTCFACVICVCACVYTAKLLGG